MKRLALPLFLAAACASAQPMPGGDGGPGMRGRGGPPLAGRTYADPSAVIAIEGAFARMAQEKGQWPAFLAYAAPDAVLFTTQLDYAQVWLKDRPSPRPAVAWQPHQVWSSCDGTLMVSHGAWQRAGGFGWFTTIWQRQPDGGYKWIFDHGDNLKQPLAAPEMISGLVADCPGGSLRGPGGPPPGRHGKPQQAKPKPLKVKDLPPLDPRHRSGKSGDGTLAWDVAVEPSGARTLTVEWKKDGAVRPVTVERVAAEASSSGRP